MLSFLVVVCLTTPLERLFQCQNIYVYFRIQVVSRESRTMIRSSTLSLHFLNQSTYSLASFLRTIVRTADQSLAAIRGTVEITHPKAEWVMSPTLDYDVVL